MTDETPKPQPEEPTLSDIRLFGNFGFGLRFFMSAFTVFTVVNFATELMATLHVKNNPETMEQVYPFGLVFEAYLSAVLFLLAVSALSAKLTMESLFLRSGVPLYQAGSKTPVRELRGWLQFWPEYRLEVKLYLLAFPLAFILPVFVQLLAGS